MRLAAILILASLLSCVSAEQRELRASWSEIQEQTELARADGALDSAEIAALVALCTVEAELPAGPRFGRLIQAFLLTLEHESYASARELREPFLGELAVLSAQEPFRATLLSQYLGLLDELAGVDLLLARSEFDACLRRALHTHPELRVRVILLLGRVELLAECLLQGVGEQAVLRTEMGSLCAEILSLDPEVRVFQGESRRSQVQGLEALSRQGLPRVGGLAYLPPEGGVAQLDSALEPSSSGPVMLVFVSSNCRYCPVLLGRCAELQQARAPEERFEVKYVKLWGGECEWLHAGIQAQAYDIPTPAADRWAASWGVDAVPTYFLIDKSQRFAVVQGTLPDLEDLPDSL